MTMGLGFRISLLARHLTQYACIYLPPFLSMIINYLSPNVNMPIVTPTGPRAIAIIELCRTLSAVPPRLPVQQPERLPEYPAGAYKLPVLRYPAVRRLPRKRAEWQG